RPPPASSATSHPAPSPPTSSKTSITATSPAAAAPPLSSIALTPKSPDNKWPLSSSARSGWAHEDAPRPPRRDLPSHAQRRHRRAAAVRRRFRRRTGLPSRFFDGGPRRRRPQRRRLSGSRPAGQLSRGDLGAPRRAGRQLRAAAGLADEPRGF